MYFSDLHAARGVAALIVMFSHISLVNEYEFRVRVGIDAILNAHAAVVFFFVLSGFVLSASLDKSGLGRFALARFAVRRMLRIYPALCFAFFLSVGIWLLGPSLNVGDRSDWITRVLENFYSLQMSPIQILSNLLPISFAANPPTWSIFVEIAGSILIPFLFFAFGRGFFFVALGLAICTISSAYLSGSGGGGHLLSYLVFFSFGVFVYIVRPLSNFGSKALLSLAIFFATLLIFSRVLIKILYFGEVSPLPVHYDNWLLAMVEGVFSAGLVTCVAAPAWSARALAIPSWIGDFSYSLYLVHMPMIFLFTRLAAAQPISLLPMGDDIVLWIGVPLASFFTARLSFFLVEKPSIQAGRSLPW